MVSRVLMIAFHFPPQRGSSGVHRTERFAHYLPQYGWQPIVLTAHPRAYGADMTQNYRDPPGATIERAFALDAARHLAIAGRYFRASALPDRWASWWWGAVPRALQLCRNHKIDLIWSTYPIATAHKIGATIHRRTGIPWVADFRDPMIEPDFPPDRRVRAAVSAIEQRALKDCAAAVFATEGMRDDYQRRYPDVAAERLQVIENGFDEKQMAALLPNTGPAVDQSRSAPARPFILLHSGIVYPSERDPRHLFQALAVLRRSGLITAASFQLVLRAAMHENALIRLASECGVAELVRLTPPLAHADALREMVEADGLLLLQASNCNRQIPAKFYEYLRVGRPIIALTDAAGETARVARQVGVDTIAPLDNTELIVQALSLFLQRVRSGSSVPIAAPVVASNSRQQRTAQLARLFDTVKQDSSYFPAAER